MDTIVLALINSVLFLILLWSEVAESIQNRYLYQQSIDRTNKNITTRLKEWVLAMAPYTVYRVIASYIDKTVHTKNNNGEGVLLQDITPGRILLINICLLILSYNIQMLSGILWYQTLFAGIILQTGLYFLLTRKAQNNKEIVERKLPEVLEIMARVYRVHTDLRIALQEVAANATEPVIKQYFSDIVKLSRFGYTIEEAMETVARKIKSTDFDFIITSIQLNIPVGGDLSQLFEKTAQLLRKRKEAKEEISSVMFQSKMSAIISASLVPLITILSFSSGPEYRKILIENPNGRLIFMGCLLWWAIGVLLIRKNSRVYL